MATLTIRDLDEHLKAKLRVRATGNGRSMEAEVRDILRLALDERPPVTCCQAVGDDVSARPLAVMSGPVASALGRQPRERVAPRAGEALGPDRAT